VTRYLVTRPRLTAFRYPLSVKWVGGRFPGPPNGGSWAGNWMTPVVVNEVVQEAGDHVGELREEF
jgi:hypothetical protein